VTETSHKWIGGIIHVNFDHFRRKKVKVEKRTKKQLIDKLKELCQRIVKLEKAETIPKHMEEELRGKSEFLNSVINHASEGIIVLDENVKYRLINPASGRIMGYNPEDWLGKPAGTKVHPDDRKTATYGFLKALRGESSRIEARFLGADGLYRTLDINCNPLNWAGKHHVISVVTDITECKRVEKELRVKDSAIASSINAIAITDPELNMTYINNSFLELWGYESDEDVLGKPATEFWQARRSASEIIDILRDRRSWIGELVARRKDGSLFDVQVWASMVSNEAGKPICNMASFIDITERKRAEEQLQETNRLLREANRQLQENQQELIQSEKMASIGQLSAGVAHEINNPISFIMVNLRILEGYVKSFKSLFAHCNELSAAIRNCNRARQEAALERIERIRAQKELPYILKDINGLVAESIEGTERICEIVRDLGSFARADEAQVNEVDINECIETTLKIIGNELKYRCTVNKHLNPLPSIYCYPGQLKQVFMNLLLNAAHAIPERGEITITTEVADSHIVVKVSDTGAGILPENLSRIFDPFFTTKDAGKGTGLGLSISQRIIQKHSGTIEVESQVGKGTTFTIHLPVEGVPDS
jgi:PAS domain S-box-containing protein